MEYSFLQDFTSLLEVFTAIYVSMFLDEILKNFWTPDYKEEISRLIKGMNIPAINFFVTKVEKNIEANAKEIGGHMKRKAAFFFAFCMSLLLLAGLEVHSPILKDYGYVIVALLSAFAGLFIFVGRWMFSRLRMVAFSIGMYVFIFCLFYFSPVVEHITKWAWVSGIDDKIATILLLDVLSVPILWQVMLIWLYSRCYKGYMEERVSREAYIYGKAYIAYKIKDMAALPREYEVVARDFVKAPSREQDTSLSSLNDILVKRLEVLCAPPEPIVILWSWIRFNWRGRHNREAEYIEKNGFDYDTMQVSDQPVQNNVLEGDYVSKKRTLFYILGMISATLGYYMYNRWWKKE